MHENTTPDMENFSYWSVWFIWHEIILSANCSNNYICRLLEPWKKERRGWKVDADQASNEILRVAFCTFFDSCELSECWCEKGKSVNSSRSEIIFTFLLLLLFVYFAVLMWEGGGRGELRWIACINHCVVNTKEEGKWKIFLSSVENKTQLSFPLKNRFSSLENVFDRKSSHESVFFNLLISIGRFNVNGTSLVTALRPICWFVPQIIQFCCRSPLTLSLWLRHRPDDTSNFSPTICNSLICATFAWLLPSLHTATNLINA